MQQEQIIQVQELSKGVESIVAVDWKHPRWVPGACSPQLSWPRGTWARTGELWDTSIKCVFSFLLLGFRITSFVIPEPSLTSQTIQEGSRGQPYHPPDIKPLYCVPASMTLLFQESGHKWVFREQPFSCLLGILADNPLSLSGALLWLAKPALPSPPPPPDPASSLLPLGRWSPDSVSERVGLSLFCLCRLFTRPCRPQAGEGKKAELQPRTAPCWAGSESGRLRFVSQHSVSNLLVASHPGKGVSWRAVKSEQLSSTTPRKTTWWMQTTRSEWMRRRACPVSFYTHLQQMWGVAGRPGCKGS